MNTRNSLWQRLLSSAAFRSGYRLSPAADPRAHPLPALPGTRLELSALHPHQIQRGVDAAFVRRLLPVIDAAADIDLGVVDQRVPLGHPAKGSALLWPGGHYRLLAACVQVFQPRRIVEIGTARGISFLSMAAYAKPDTSIITYDVMPLDKLNGFLTAQDLSLPGRELRLGDLADPIYFESQADVLRGADMLFMDGPKDGRFEYRFWEQLEVLGLKRGCLCIVDDIRLATMLKFWHSLRHPRLDLISFGHHTGTGIFWWS